MFTRKFLLLLIAGLYSFVGVWGYPAKGGMNGALPYDPREVQGLKIQFYENSMKPKPLT